jgi:multiple sugar transport system substrate-binding protein
MVSFRVSSPCQDIAQNGFGIIGDIYSLKFKEVQDKAISPITDQIFNNNKPVAEALKEMEKKANDILSKK